MAQPAITPSNQQLFGVDLALVDGDLGVQAQNGLMDLQTVSGIPNLQAAILRRLMTNPGDLVMHQDYGSNIMQLLSQGIGAVKTAISKFVAAALVSEPRVQKIISTTLTQTGNDSVNLNVSVQLVGQNTPTNFVFPFFLT